MIAGALSRLGIYLWPVRQSDEFGSFTYAVPQQRGDWGDIAPCFQIDSSCGPEARLSNATSNVPMAAPAIVSLSQWASARMRPQAVVRAARIQKATAALPVGEGWACSLVAESGAEGCELSANAAGNRTNRQPPIKKVAAVVWPDGNENV